MISGAELFQRDELRRTPRRRLGKVIDSFLDLREGDLVVHLAHGIGRYRGIQLIDEDGRAEEHLQIEFHGGAKIYVPASASVWSRSTWAARSAGPDWRTSAARPGSVRKRPPKQP